MKGAAVAAEDKSLIGLAGQAFVVVDLERFLCCSKQI